MPDLFQNSASNKPIEIVCALASAYVASNTPTITLRKNGGTGAAATGTVTASDAFGVSFYTPSSADVNTIGPLTIEVSGSGIDSYPITGWTVRQDNPYTRFPANAPGTSGGGLPVLDGNGNVPSSVNEYGGGTAEVDSTGLPRVGTVHNFVLGNNPGGVDGTFVGQGVVAAADTGGSNIANATNLATANASLSTLTSRITAARAGYLDNLNVGGAVASHADITALNTSASKHLLLVTVGQFEPGETYTVEMRTFAASTGAAVNADTTPTLTATGNVSGDLSANLSAATNPATGLYRWTYTPGATPTLEQIRFDGSATISAGAFTLSAYSQTVDFATAVFTATDQTHLTSIFNKLPAGNLGDATATAQAAIKAKTDLIATAAQVATAVWQDTTAGDFTVTGSVGKVVFGQLGGAFTAGTSVFTVAALVNAPAGGGGGGTGRTINEVQRIIFEKQS